MTGQQLRNSILQEAIHGRLVPNVLQPGEKTARELLEDILAMRQKAENEAKGKKAKKLTLCEIEEEPWELPEGWCWCKLGDLASINGGFAFKSTDYKKDGYRVIRISDFNEQGFVDKSIVRYEYDEKLAPYLLQQNDILMCMTGGTVGKTYYVRTINEPMLVNQRVATIRPIQLSPDYVNFFIRSPYIAQIIDDCKNSTNDNISMGDILGFCFPLPPLSIQHDIVSKLESLLPMVEDYDAAQNELKALNESLPDKIRKSVLQEAIHGRLVPNTLQPGEKTAKELLTDILAKRQKIENETKGKKAKKLSLSEVDEEPWELPEGWCWCRLGDLCEIRNGYAFQSTKYTSEGIRVIRITNVQDGFIIDNDPKFYPISTLDIIDKYVLQEGDMLMSLTGNVGRVAFLTKEYLPAALNQRVAALRFSKILSEKYIFYYLRSNQFLQDAIDNSKGMAQLNMSTVWLQNYLFPLPPLSIQHSIVSKIEELLVQIGKL